MYARVWVCTCEPMRCQVNLLVLRFIHKTNVKYCETASYTHSKSFQFKRKFDEGISITLKHKHILKHRLIGPTKWYSVWLALWQSTFKRWITFNKLRSGKTGGRKVWDCVGHGMAQWHGMAKIVFHTFTHPDDHNIIYPSQKSKLNIHANYQYLELVYRFRLNVL